MYFKRGDILTAENLNDALAPPLPPMSLWGNTSTVTEPGSPISIGAGLTIAPDGSLSVLGSSLGTALPLMAGTAAAGTALNASHEDHIHPVDTSRYAASNPAGYQTAANVTSTLTAYAKLASPALSGTPTAPTQTAGKNDTSIATTAFVQAAVVASTTGVSSFNTRTGAITLSNSDVLTVLPASTTAPVMDGTATAGVATSWARGDHVHPTDTSRYAASNPQGYQTAAQVAAAVPVASAVAPLMDGTAAAGSSTLFARGDHVHPSDTTRAPITAPSFKGSPTIGDANAGIEIGSTSAANTPYIDFHSVGAATDYDVKLSASGGSTSTAGQGKLTITAAGGVTTTATLSTTAEMQANVFRLAGAGSPNAYFYGTSAVTQIALDGGWRLEYNRSNGALTYYNSGNGALFTIDGSGNATSYGSFAGTSVIASAGFYNNQSSANGYWTADASNVYMRFSGAWGWTWSRTTGRLNFLNGSGTILYAWHEGGAGWMVPTLDGNWWALGWTGAEVRAFMNGSLLADLVFSQDVSGSQYAVRSLAITPAQTGMVAFGSGGTVSWGITPSDRRLKENIEPSTYDAVAALNSIQIYSCDMRTTNTAPWEHWDCAVIADEVESVIPNAYLEPLPGIQDSYAGIRDLPLIATLIKAVQQLTERVAALEAKP